jgi:hypothetical protein
LNGLTLPHPFWLSWFIIVNYNYFFKGKEGSERQQHFLSHLAKSKNLLSTNNANPISAWHGTSPKKLDSICWYGLLTLSSTDPGTQFYLRSRRKKRKKEGTPFFLPRSSLTLFTGYFGKGIYLTQEPQYGEFYAESIKDKEGSFSLLLCWALLGRPYPIEKVNY